MPSSSFLFGLLCLDSRMISAVPLRERKERRSPWCRLFRFSVTMPARRLHELLPWNWQKPAIAYTAA